MAPREGGPHTAQKRRSGSRRPEVARDQRPPPRSPGLRAYRSGRRNGRRTEPCQQLPPHIPGISSIPPRTFLPPLQAGLATVSRRPRCPAQARCSHGATATGCGLPPRRHGHALRRGENPMAARAQRAGESAGCCPASRRTTLHPVCRRHYQALAAQPAANPGGLLGLAVGDRIQRYDRDRRRRLPPSRRPSSWRSRLRSMLLRPQVRSGSEHPWRSAP